MITLYGTVRTNSEAEPVEVVASGETYAEARAVLDGLVPEGGLLLGISRWPRA